jgi:prefoldin beta subunit
MPELTDQQKEMINQFQMYQQQLQSVSFQKESLRLQNIEIDKALEELNATKEEKAYKITGQIMISKTVDELKKELNETKELVGVRTKSLEKIEEKINSKLNELQEKLKEIK